MILYSGGVGAILGALVFGGLSDAWGRKSTMIIGTFICAASSGLMGIVPSGSWEVFAVLRFFIGVGLTAGVTPSLAIQVELTPTRHRTLLTSFYLVFASAGGFLASGVSAALLEPLGWRGVAMLGMAPAFVGVLIWFYVPEFGALAGGEGPLHRGARRGGKAARLRQLGAAADQAPAAPPRGRLSELYRQPSMFWETVIIWGGSSMAAYGVYLWGPTIVAMVLSVPVSQAAKFFVFVTLGGVTGKIVVTLLAPLTGRRWLGVVWGFGGVVALAAAGYYSNAVVGGLPAMVILLCASTFFIEGGFANFAPYTVERYGVRLGARASGLGQAANGVGKIVGPLSLAPDRRQQQHRIAAGDLGCGAAGLPVPRLLHVAGGAVLRVSRGRDARQGDGGRQRRGGGGTAARGGARHRNALSRWHDALGASRQTPMRRAFLAQ